MSEIENNMEVKKNKKKHKPLKIVLLIIGAFVIFMLYVLLTNPFAGSKPKTDSNSETSAGSSTAASSSTAGGETSSEVKPKKTPEEIAAKYEKLLEPADDEFDYKWANDYNYARMLHTYNLFDSKGYSQVFNFSRPTKEDMYRRIDANSYLAPEYKQFIKDYVNDWLTLWPETDFSILYYNLGTLKIERIADNKTLFLATSPDAVASYVTSVNKICVGDDCTFFDKTSDDYIVLTHELTHAARKIPLTEVEDYSCLRVEEGSTIRMGFTSDIVFGNYEEEAIITNLAYEMQGLGKKSRYYYYETSIWRLLSEGIDYDGADFMNHSINYLCDKLQERLDELGDKTPAYHYINLIDAQAKLHWERASEDSVDFTDFTEIVDLETRNFLDLRGVKSMTKEESDKLFEEFWSDIGNLMGERKPYVGVSRELYEEYWEKETKDLIVE